MFQELSSVFIEGVVTYSNEAKIKRLGVKKETLEKYGAVSEETAREMVLGLKTDTGISVTGIAGPYGGTLRKTSRSCIYRNKKWK